MRTQGDIVVARGQAETHGPSSSAAFARTLVTLTRTVWQPDCTFETALAAICKAGALALGVERVTLWSYEPALLRLHSLFVFLGSGIEPPATPICDLPLDDDDYVAALQDVRTITIGELEADAGRFASHRALHAYLHTRGIGALLQVPVFLEGELLAVLAHESDDAERRWTPEDSTFAASLGDYVGMSFEIVRRRAAEEQVRHMRLHDSGTGLPRREFLEEAVRQRFLADPHGLALPVIVHIRVDASAVAQLTAADAPTEADIVIRVANCLRTVCSQDMALSRMHTNGLAFLLPAHDSEADAIRLAERCLDAVRGLASTPGEKPPGAAVGIAFAVAGHDGDARTLLRQAEEAADHAHQTEGTAFAVFDLDHHTAVMNRLQQESALRLAWANRGFELHYQPEFDAETCRWVAAEALLRWRVGDELRTAAEFIGTAEASGLILPLGSWVLHRACKDASAWPACPDGSHAAARVNVSARQFDAPGLADDVAAALAASGLDAARLCLEITETTLMTDIAHAQQVLKAITATGVRVAIDDFGTGYGSLVYLKNLPADILKIDRAFVSGLPDDRVSSAIVGALTGLAAALDIDVIAEGVETLAQQRALQAAGVRRMQGWLYARAMDNTALCLLLREDAPQLR